MSLEPFADEATSLQIEGLTIENRLDRVSLFGSIDMTKDRDGLLRARELRALLEAVVLALEREGDSLPAAVEVGQKTDTTKIPSNDQAERIAHKGNQRRSRAHIRMRRELDAGQGCGRSKIRPRIEISIRAHLLYGAGSADMSSTAWMLYALAGTNGGRRWQRGPQGQVHRQRGQEASCRCGRWPCRPTPNRPAISSAAGSCR